MPKPAGDAEGFPSRLNKERGRNQFLLLILAGLKKRGHPLAGSVKWAPHFSVSESIFSAILFLLPAMRSSIRTWVFIGFSVAPWPEAH